MKFLSKYSLLIYLYIAANQVIGQSTSIESINPANGYSGQVINITGVGLDGADRVFFGSVEGRVISVSDQLIEVEAPNGATFDNVTVFNSTTRLYYNSERFMLSYGGDQGIVSTDFDSQLDVSAESGLYDVTISDLDGDGKNDIIGANSNSSSATILRNLSIPGSISTVKATINLGTSGLNVNAGDLNGDGKPEVIFSEGGDGNRLIILVNFSTSGNLNFTRQYLTLNGSSTKRVVIRDLDLDGKPDIIVSDQSNNKIFIVQNTSTGGNLSFSGDIIELTVDNALSTAGLDVEDLNGDGKPEIITNQFLTDGGGFYIATNQSSPGNFSFSSFNQFNSAGTFVNLKVGDINKDGKPDVVATLFLSSAIAIFYNETNGIGGTPQFSAARNIATDSRPWGVDFGDLDGDGHIDIAVSTIGANKTINVLNNDGSGLNFSKVALPVTFINRNIKLGDIDGDSKPDIVFTSVDDESNNITSSKISILRNNRCIMPVITPQGPINSCAGNPVILETQKIAGLTYEWRQDGNVVKSGGENFIELNDITASGSYTVTIISDGGACSEISDAVDVTITSSGSLPGATISSNAPVCVGGTLTLSSSDVGATAYEWRGPDNFTATGISVEVENFNANKVGRYYLDIYAGSCIIETISNVVDIVSAPNFILSQSGAGTYCEGETVSLNTTPNDPNFSFQWYKDTSPITGATSATYNPTNSGRYYVEVTDQVNTFCPTIYTDTLEITFLAPPQVNFNLPATACVATTVTFTDESMVADESLARYNWDFGDGSVSSEINPSHTYNSDGIFEVTLDISYDGFPSCSSQSSQQIVINGEINVLINASESAVCEGGNVTLSVDDIYESYQWSTGETSSTITVSQTNTYEVIVTDENGCEGFSEIVIQALPIPEVDITASATSISTGDMVSLTATGLIDYNWYAGSELLNDTNDQIEYAPSSTTTIKVEGEDENGCFGSAEIVIEVEETNIGDRITPMRFFSPNNDAIAQFWEIENIENFTQCGVEIYDQQGNMIYEAKPYNNDWEGTANGSPVPDGVYYFVVRCDGSGVEKSGSITLLR